MISYQKVVLLLIVALFRWNTHAQWSAVNTGITNLNTIPMAVSGTDLFAGTYGGGVFFSANNGASWTAVNNGITDLDIFAMTSDGTNTFAGSYGGGVFLTTNNGTSWTTVNNGITNLNIYALATDGTNVYAGTLGAGIFVSNNNGASWTPINTGLTNLNVVTIYLDGSNIFIGTAGGGAFLSTNNGSSWTAVNNGITSTSVRSFVRNGSTMFAGTNTGGIFSSTDNGANWTPANTGLTNSTVWTMTEYGSNIFAGTNGGGIFLSTDNGGSWSPVNTGLPATPDIWSIVISGTNIFTGINGGGGVYTRALSELVPIDASFNYSSAAYCIDANNPTPTITGTSGGTFNSTPPGLNINSTTGTINLSSSTPGTYSVTYTVNGSSANVSVTVNAMDDASFNYSASSFCMDATNPTPTITGLVGGTFSSTAGLNIDGALGTIDLGASTPGIYTVTYSTNGSCPNSSDVVVELTQVDTSIVVNGASITANAVGASYQWLDCDNGMNIIAGETNATFTPTSNGNYAVEVTSNGCTDTSACVTMTDVSLSENGMIANITVYPNPTSGVAFIDLGTLYEGVEVTIRNLPGQEISRISFVQTEHIELKIDGATGFYIIDILTSDNKKATLKLLKD